MDIQRQMKIYKDELLKTAYGELSEAEQSSYSSVFVELCRDVRKTNERYNNRKITIYNLYRQESEIINSLIIGLAHHVDFCKNGETDNTQKFREIYQDMLFKALDADRLSFDELKKSNDYQTKIALRNALSTYWPDNTDTSSEKIIEVKNCFEIKDDLKKMGFTYNQLIQSWDKSVPVSEISKVTTDIHNMKPEALISTRSSNRMVFAFNAFVCVSGKTYAYKDILKDNGYHFDMNTKLWRKKIVNNQFLSEQEKILEALPKGQGIKVEMTY